MGLSRTSFLELGTAIARTSIEVAKLDPRMRVVTIERNWLEIISSTIFWI